MAVIATRFNRRPDGWRIAGAVVAALLVAGIVVALVSGGSGERSADSAGSAGDSAEYSTAEVAADEAREASDAGGVGVERDDAGSVAPVAAAQPRIIRTAAIDLRVKGDVLDAVARAEGIAVAAGGFVSSSSTSAAGRSARGELTLRVPADRFDEVRRRLGDLGTVRAAETGGEDVGGQLVDLGARLRALRAEEAALETLLRQAGDIGAILQVRDRLTGVRTDIEQLAAQQASLEDRVALATIHLTLRRAGAPTPPPDDDGGGSRLAASWGTAVDAAEAVVGGMIVVVGAVLPFAALGALAWTAVAWTRRRRAATTG